jgi:cytochrome P450
MSETNGDSLSMINLLRPEVMADPYPLYRRLRETDPVHWDAAMGYWVLTRHADVVEALQDARLSAARTGDAAGWIPEEYQAALGPAMYAVARQMLFLDPPDHTRVRSLVNRAFTSRVVEGMRPRMQAIIDGLLDQAQEAGRMDVVADFAYPLPAIVIAELLGVPAEDRGRFIKWSGDFGTLLEDGVTLEAAVQALQGVVAFISYFRELIEARRDASTEDLLHGLITAREQNDALSEEELLGNCILLLAAGHGTTTHLIGNGTLALLRHPDQMRRLHDDPSLAPSAVNELLRYDSPVQTTARVAMADLQLGGRTIERGQGVTLRLGAANRDPERFPDPDRLDLARPELRHVAFGHGIHFCVGAPLARIEGQMAFASLLKRFPEMELETDTPEWEPGIVFRGLRSLPVRWS